MGCSVGTVNGFSKSGGNGQTFIRVDCGKLTCPRCGWKKAKKYHKAVTKQAEKLKLQRFLTVNAGSRIDPGRG